MIKEHQNQISNLQFQGQINENEAAIIIDTGAEANYIGEKMLKQLNINEKEIEKQTSKVEFGNGETGDIIGKADLEISFQALPNTKFKESFKIIKESNMKIIILGLAFMNRQHVKIDFHNYYMQIGQEYITFENDYNKIIEKTPDDDIIKKNTSIVKKKAMSLINDYKISNP